MKDTKTFLKNKKKKWQYGCERYKTLLEDEKNKKWLKRAKNIIKLEKTLYYNYNKVL